MTIGRNIMNTWNVADDKGNAKGRNLSAERRSTIGI